MKLSVVIPTLGRDDVLIDTVRALSRQSVAPLEILVVDQNDPPFENVDTEMKRHPLVRHIKSATTGCWHNCNVGIQEARGDIVLFLDDDIIPDERLVEMHLKNYGDPSVSGVAGRVEQPQNDLDPATIRVVGKYHPWSGKVTGNFNARARAEVDSVPGGNVSFRIEVLKEIGGFDVGYGGNGYYGEADIALRVVESGHRIVFDPDATLKHLMAARGGNRVADKARHTYFFLKNGLRLARQHSPRAAIPWIVSQMIAYSAAKSVYNANPRIFGLGLKAIWEGLICDS